jgi:GH35 family endo-1,4-beta-xylanase
MKAKMKINYNNYSYLGRLAAFALFLFGLSACKQDAQFNGKRPYIVQADSVASFPGNNRLKISFEVPDKNAVTAKIYWNNRMSSTTVPINKIAGTDSVSTIIGPLDEGNYSFEVITYDANGVTSIPVKIDGTVYGAKYALTLPNRQAKDITYDAGTVSVSLGAAGVGAVRSEITYNDVNNVSHTVNIPVGTNTVTLSNVNPGAVGALNTTVQHRTFFHPALAIDTFNTAYQTDTVITANLRTLAKAKNIQFGSLISSGGGITDGVVYDGSPNGIYTNICKTEFNVGEATWGATRWAQNGAPSNFDDVNAVINWCRPQYDKVMAMALVGPNNYMPAWFNNGTYTPAQMDGLLKSLIYEIMDSNSNKTKVDIWDVANELFNEDGTYKTMAWNNMGWEDDASGLKGTDQINLKHPIFIGKAFQYCRDKTNALLELRDYGIENTDPKYESNHKYKAFYELVRHLKATNRPIGVVGIQAHIMIGKGMAVGTSVNMNADVAPVGYDGFKDAIKQYKATGVEVHLTELDIVSLVKASVPVPFTDALAQQQRQDYYNVIKAALGAGANSIYIWGARDNNDATWRVDQNPLLRDVNYHKKPAYYGVERALFEASKL